MDVRAPPPSPRRESLGEHLHHGVEVLARDVAVRVRPPHRLEQRILLPLLACHRRHDLLGQDVERVRRDDQPVELALVRRPQDRKSTRLNSSHGYISYAVFCLKKKKTKKAT